jgi:hypothetical protein
VLFDRSEALLARPVRDADWSALHAWRNETRLGELAPSKRWALPARSMPLRLIARSYQSFHWQAEVLLGKRDALTVAIGLELHRRRHGAYPATLAELSPTLLPRVPADRITGKPIRYLLVDGKPIVYSVGVDRDDDGGRPWTHPRTKEPDAIKAAEWPGRQSKATPRDGDWIVYDARPAQPAIQQPSTQDANGS